MAAPKAGTRDRILDSAEHLFAAKGYEGASAREIAALSGVTLGTFSYHFAAKEKLLQAVVERRFSILLDMRRELYAEIKQTKPFERPSFEDVVNCIITPFLEMAINGTPEWKSYTILMCRLMYAGSHSAETDVSRFSDAAGKELLGWLREAAPDAAPADLGYAYQFMIANMADSSTQWERERLSRIIDREDARLDFDELRDRLLKYSVAGLRALLNR